MAGRMQIPPTVEPLRSRGHAAFLDKVQEARLEDIDLVDYFEVVFGVAAWIYGERTPGKVFGVGIAGAQGSGKSTFSRLLAHLLTAVFDVPAAMLSLDDFYMTRAQRKRLASEIHPLLKVRGVPGTHDMPLMAETISSLKEGKGVRVPRFDKAVDDRADAWSIIESPPEILLVEGWCWGALPAADDELEKPVNELEREKDPNGVWRRYVDDCLGGNDYRTAFAATDALLFLAVPDMEAVYRWRRQQERELAARRGGDRVMNGRQVREFIMYYERITRRMLIDMPARADITIYLGADHATGAVKVRR